MRKQPEQLVIDVQRLQREMRARGFCSVREFADHVGVHRNTVGSYLSGRASLPSALARILDALELTPADVLSVATRRRQVPGLAVTELVEELHRAAPQAAFVLFGSRARGTAKRYSDYDLGVYRPGGLEFAEYSRLLDLVGDWNDRSLVVAQLVDLGRVDAAFLGELADDLVFLAGSHKAWCELLRKAGMRLDEGR